MSGKEQRKGRDAELELVRKLHEYGYTSVHAGNPMNFGTEPDIVGLDGIHVECKRHEGERMTEWLTQARADSEKFGDGLLPAVFWRKNRGRWIVAMDLVDWITLYCAAGGKPDGTAETAG